MTSTRIAPDVLDSESPEDLPLNDTSSPPLHDESTRAPVTPEDNYCGAAEEKAQVLKDVMMDLTRDANASIVIESD